MANQKQAATRRLKMSEKAQHLLDLHFPGFPSQCLWRRRTNDGFTTLPRTLPLVMQAIDDQSKGQPAGHTLFCLWARSPDHPLVTIENPLVFASEAGFEGNRAVDTWRRRMKRLRELSFIHTKKGPAGEFHSVLLLNPNVAVEWMRSKGWVQDDLYGRFITRLDEVGGYGELETIRAWWEEDHAAQGASSAAAVTTEEAGSSGTAEVTAPGSVSLDGSMSAPDGGGE